MKKIAQRERQAVVEYRRTIQKIDRFAILFSKGGAKLMQNTCTNMYSYLYSIETTMAVTMGSNGDKRRSCRQSPRVLDDGANALGGKF